MLIHHTVLKLISNGVELAQVVALVALILCNLEAATPDGTAHFNIDFVVCAEIHVHSYWTNGVLSGCISAISDIIICCVICVLWIIQWIGISIHHFPRLPCKCKFQLLLLETDLRFFLFKTYLIFIRSVLQILRNDELPLRLLEVL